MSFSSIHFIFLFLPLFLGVYFLLPAKKWKTTALVLASLVFFAWSDLSHLPVLIGLVIANYLFGLQIDRRKRSHPTDERNRLLPLMAAFNLLVLFFYKYLGFFSSQILALFNSSAALPSVAAPLGISYLTFSSISYLLDADQDAIKPESNFLRFTAYLTMFPKLIQGPITRYDEVSQPLEKPTKCSSNLDEGIRRFIQGLAKKVLLANNLQIISAKIFSISPTDTSALLAWTAIIAFSLYVYFDFSGYTDMAIGLGKILGFNLPENFAHPYTSRSITEFWRRWHITLTRWMRTYVFLPLEIRRRRQKTLRLQTNIIIVFLLTGLWHGAGLNFLAWGLYFGLILALEASGFEKILKKTPAPIQHLYTLAVLMLGWMVFRQSNLSALPSFLSALFGSNGWIGDLTFKNLEIAWYLPVIPVAILLCLPIRNWIEARLPQKPPARLALDAVYLSVFALSVALILNSGFQFFMYAQF